MRPLHHYPIRSPWGTLVQAALAYTAGQGRCGGVVRDVETYQLHFAWGRPTCCTVVRAVSEWLYYHEYPWVHSWEMRETKCITIHVLVISSRHVAAFLLPNRRTTNVTYNLHVLPSIINSTYSADASVLVQMSTESAQTTCMHCYNLRHLQTPCRQSIRKWNEHVNNLGVYQDYCG